MLKKIWADPVWSKVISVGVLTLISSITAYFSGWTPAIVTVFQRVIDFILGSSSVPNLVLFLLSVCTLYLFIIFIKNFKSTSIPVEPWKNYRKDNFFNLIWEWSFDSSNDIVKIHTLCPKCQYQISPRYIEMYPLECAYNFKCDVCGYEVAQINGVYSEIESKVKRMAQQKLRTGSWRNVVL